MKQRATKPIHSLLALPLASIITGIIAASYHILIAPWSLIFALMSLYCAYFIQQYFKKYILLTGTLFFWMGFFSLTLQQEQNNRLRSCYTNKPLTIVATVNDVQVSPGSLFEGIAQLTTHSIREEGATESSPVSFSFSCYQKTAFDLQVGDTVLLEQTLLPRPTDTTNTGNPTFGDYLIKEGLVSAVFLQHDIPTKIIARPNWSMSRWIWKQKNRILRSLQEKISPLAYSYLALIFLGYKQIEQSHELRNTFNLWGLAHFLARAGLHIMLFIFMWQYLLRFIPLPLSMKRLLLFFVCSVYALFSWSSIPFFRAYVLFVLARTADFLDQQTNFLHLLSITCLFVLCSNPMQLFFLDFQLTFALTFSLGWFSQIGKNYEASSIYNHHSATDYHHNLQQTSTSIGSKKSKAA